MKKITAALLIPFFCVTNAQAELIQHTDQIAEIRFTGSSYQLGQYVGKVAGTQILDGIDRFDATLGIMLPGLNVSGLAKSFDEANIYGKLQQVSPDAAAYIQGLSESLNRHPNLLLAVGMSDEAILESQRSGGLGFLQTEIGHHPSAPAKCTSMAVAAEGDQAWAASNFDYMGVNYQGLIVLKHTDTDGLTRVIQTWAGLIPYGGVSKGGQVLTMNTMADEGVAREKAGGEITGKNATPSYYLSWEVYNAQSYSDVVSLFQRFPEYTAFFTYTLTGAQLPAMNIENTYSGQVHVSQGPWKAHANHSLYEPKSYVDEGFAAQSVARQQAVETFMCSTSVETPASEVRALLESKPLWKGRGPMMGTVTSTYYRVDGKRVDLYLKTDAQHPEVHISNQA